MAGQESLVFHDFFGSFVKKADDDDKLQHATVVDSSNGSENCLSLVEEVEQEVCVSPSAQIFCQPKDSTVPTVLSDPVSLEIQASKEFVSDPFPPKREDRTLRCNDKYMHGARQHRITDTTHNNLSLHKPLQMDADPLDGSQFLKVARTERLEDRKRGYQEMVTEDLHLKMSPPQSSLKAPNPHSSTISMMNVPAFVPKKCEVPLLGPQNMGFLFGPGRTEHKILQDEHVMRDSAAVQLQVAPADEGSRTGLRNSNAGIILNSRFGSPGTGNVAPTLLTKSKSNSQGLGTESGFATSHQMAPITRQLTIFYGGQAHVFEDVSSEKVEAIMALAGSSGRSWSTVYTPQPKSSMPQTGSEGRGATHSRVFEHENVLKSSVDAQIAAGSVGKASEINELFK